ncbi:DUF1642 domain-containing protein [Lactococcus petauri]|uniref:DUF1642 domain-containing protein n=1 Tax=Lactococcus petauri TaxID=1940789 RepID=UPI0038533C66
MKKFEEEFNYLIELSGKVLTGQIEAEEFETHRAIFLNKYCKKQQPEIPEVPQFVAEWYEENKERLEIALWDYICDFEHQEKDEFHEFMKRITTKPLETIFSMKNGYTVAKEKRYEVVFLEDDTTRQILMENHAGHHFIEEEDENYGYWKQNFTEKEIKAVNEKFWHLSVPVKNEQIEVEE